jgi:regulator of RNase E activity RraA
LNIGFRICERERKVSDDIVAQFKVLPVANVSDTMGRLQGGGPRLLPMHTSGVLAGPALTVRVRPGDNLMLHKAIDMAVPGDVIVVDGDGHLANSLMGELMLAHAINRGIAGFVIYGAIRDADAFKSVNLPTFASGINHRGPYKDGPGEINVSISLDGMVVNPGDLILGDSDGVVSVPIEMTKQVLADTLAKQSAEEKQMEAIKAKTNDRSWVDKALREKGCEFPK